MRTNKKCPLYNEEGEPVAWQDLGAAADGLLERQGTKITIKRKSIPTKKMEELDSPKSAQPPVVRTPLPKKEIPAPVPLLKTPSLRMKIKLISGGTPNQSTDNSPAPSAIKPPREKVEKVHGAHANGAGETPPGASQPARPPLLKLKLSNQKQKDKGVKRLKQDVDVEAARKERERMRERERQEREAYEQALVEEREREEREREEREKERERQEREERELKRRTTHINEAASGRGNKVENKLVFVNKGIKKKPVRAKDDPELLRRREREREQAERMERERERQEAEEYQRALEEELKREQEELDRKEERERAEREERLRMEQAKIERERHRQHVKEKERRRERERIREEARAREAELEAQRAAQEREERERLAREEELQQRERERIRQKNMKIKHMKERTKVMSVPTSGLSEKERGKGIKRRPDPPPPSYHHTPDYGNAPKRLRKKGGEVSFLTH